MLSLECIIRDAVTEHAIVLLDYYYMDQGWMQFEEAKMCDFQMRLGTHKNYHKDNNCQLKHSKT